MWAETKFIIATPTIKDIRLLSDDIYAVNLMINKSMLIIGDVKYYIDNEDEIKSWCNQSLTSWTQTGMIIGFINDEERNLFLMRWS